MKPDFKSLIEKNQEHLLDMELRGNTLLSLDSGEKVLEVALQDPQVLFKHLVEQQQSLRLVGQLEGQQAENLNALSLNNLAQFLSDEPEYTQDTTSLTLSLSQEALEKSLVFIQSEAQTKRQQHGTDALFLALGFITWYEDINSFKPRHAPLILIPVELYRENISDVFHLRYTGCGIQTNQLLAAKLKHLLDLDFPTHEGIYRSQCLLQYFGQVQSIISKKARWAMVTDRSTIGFFSPERYAIADHLAQNLARIQADTDAQEHHVLRQYLDQNFDPIDDTNLPESVSTILNADTSQKHVLQLAQSGQSFAVSGASGTGKTQTITNLIAQAALDHQRVLVVSEKLADLNGIQKQLEQCQLSHLVLPYFGHQVQSQHLSHAIKKALQRDKIADSDLVQPLSIESIQQKIHHYETCVNSPIGQTNFNFKQAVGFLTRYAQILKENQIELEPLQVGTLDLTRWDTAHYLQASEKIDLFIQYLEQHGTPADNAFVSTQLCELDESHWNDIKQCIEKIIETSQVQWLVADEFRESLGLHQENRTFGDIQRCIQTLQHLQKTPDLMGIDTDAQLWRENGAEIIRLAHYGRELQRDIMCVRGTFIESALNYDWTNVLHIFNTTGQRFWRFLSSDYRSAKETYEGMCRAEVTDKVNDWITNINQLISARENQSRFTQEAKALTRVIGNHYQAENTDWEHILKKLDWIQTSHKGLDEQTYDQGIHQYLIAHNRKNIDKKRLLDLIEANQQLQALMDNLIDKLQLAEDEFKTSFANVSLPQIKQLPSDLRQIGALVTFNHLSQELVDLDCERWKKLAGEWKAKPSLLQQAYQYNFFYLIAQQYYQQSSALHDFDLEKHEALLKTLSHEYQNVQVSVRQTIANIHHAHVTELKYEEAYGHFEALFNQGDEALSCASVLNQHTETLQQILPVFLMTPTSLAVTLKDSPAKFDLVIIDSASQLTISQSLHAILRGSQVILVGDTARLSPLELNLKSQIASEPKWDQDGIAQESSVFADFVQAGFPVCHLTTHYTSRHQQLFQFSNQRFYQNSIHLFATPELNQKGMILTHVPEGIFDPDTAHANLEEAKQVANAVIKHAKAHPELSLAVLTMSDSQKEAILHQVELHRKINPDAESFFNEKQENEAFVVAKMNEFYADLRDTVFISFGFGKNIDEQLPSQFGALSKPAGEKWLNTALNRARSQTRIFSSLHAADVLVQESSPTGVVCFNALLEFLENGMAVKKESIEPASIPFENEVIHQINSLGYAVDFAVGSGAQKVVFAVKSNVTTQAYALGIECDTSPFPPRQTVDEKVAIRDATLNQLGWRLHKVWSAQWFQTPESEMARLHQAILSAEARFEQLGSQLPADAQPLKLLTEQYQTCALRELSLKQGDKLCSISTPTLVNEISKIIEVESPIHIKQLALRLFSAVTLQDNQKKTHDAILAAVAQLTRQGRIDIDGEFIKNPNLSCAPRNRKSLPFDEYKFEFVYHGEIQQIASQFRRHGGQTPANDVNAFIASQLGFSIANKAVDLRIKNVLATAAANFHS